MLINSQTTKKRWVTSVAGIAGSLFLLVVVAYRASQWVPEFYVKRLDVPTLRGAVAKGIEEPLIDLNNALNMDGPWAISISDEQINRWLAKDLRKEFPTFLPGYASEPRIEIEDGTAKVACQYNNGRMSAVISMCVEAFAAEDPNVIGFRICNARIGAVPGLTGTAVEHLTWAGRRAKLRFRWQQQDGDPVVLVEIPQQNVATNSDVAVESIELRDGELLLRGRTHVDRVVDTVSGELNLSDRQAEPAVHVSYKPSRAKFLTLKP